MTEKRVKAAVNQAIYYRNYRRVRDRALTRLAAAYPEDYKELLEQEKANDEAQGKKWIDIDGTTGNSLSSVREGQLTANNKASNDGKNSGNNGGEA
jgi:hypothetical protein